MRLKVEASLSLPLAHWPIVSFSISTKSVTHCNRMYKSLPLDDRRRHVAVVHHFRHELVDEAHVGGVHRVRVVHAVSVAEAGDQVRVVLGVVFDHAAGKSVRDRAIDRSSCVDGVRNVDIVERVIARSGEGSLARRTLNYVRCGCLQLTFLRDALVTFCETR